MECCGCLLYPERYTWPEVRGGLSTLVPGFFPAAVQPRGLFHRRQLFPSREPQLQFHAISRWNYSLVSQPRYLCPGHLARSASPYSDVWIAMGCGFFSVVKQRARHPGCDRIRFEGFFAIEFGS